MENELDIISGTVRSVIFRNEENGYAVISVGSDENGTVTVVGCMPGCAPGEYIQASGRWVHHQTHGDQFNAESVDRSLPSTENAMLQYLVSGVIKGVGPVTAGRIIEKFGADAFYIMEEQPERLAEIRGITGKKAQEIGREFSRQTGIRRIMEFIGEYDIQPHVAVRLYRNFGDEAVQILRKNPYILACDYYGVSFTATDAMALRLGFDGESSERVKAAVLFEMRHNLTNGHTFLPRGKLTEATAAMLDVSHDAVETAVDALEMESVIVIDKLAGLEACYLFEMYEAEVYVARRIKEMACRGEKTVPDLASLISGMERSEGIEYAPAQRSAIREAAEKQLFVLTGGPGTGKTTTVNGILALFEKMELETVLAAPTGRSAKRLTELCGGVEAVTVHRLLEAGYDSETGEMRFAKCEDDLLKADAVIVDECSMVDLLLMRSLLGAMKNDCRLVLVGDADQLPSVGAGNIFSDIIRGSTANTVRLTEIFRQAQESDIVVNAHAINAGIMPDLMKNDADFFFMRRRDPVRAAETVVELCRTRLPERMGIKRENIQVLSPSRKGRTGVGNLNRMLQSALNPPADGKSEKKYKDFIFRTGDRVMQIKNNYDIIWQDLSTGGEGAGIFNGDVGVISSIDQEGEIVRVQFDDKLVAYQNEMLDELEPAFAVTVHKAQGSEYEAVILAACDVPQPLRGREILYTAVTRAKQLFIIVGDDGVIKEMTENFKQRKRYSGLKIRLCR